MKIRRTARYHFVEFEPPDWRNGLAPKIIEGLKLIHYRERKYDPGTKEWSFTPTTHNIDLMNRAWKAYKENKPIELDEDKTKVLMEAWMNTFKACTNEEFDLEMKQVRAMEKDPEWSDGFKVEPDQLFGIDPVEFRQTLMEEGVVGITKRFTLTRRNYE